MDVHLPHRRVFEPSLMSLAENRTDTSPSTHRITIFVKRNITRVGAAISPVALVLSSVRVLEWMRSASKGAARGVGRVFMESKSLIDTVAGKARWSQALRNSLQPPVDVLKGFAR